MPNGDMPGAAPDVSLKVTRARTGTRAPGKLVDEDDEPEGGAAATIVPSARRGSDI